MEVFVRSCVAPASRVNLRTVRRYPGWRTFLDNHRSEIWAADSFIAHARRTVVHVNVTQRPPQSGPS